MEWIKMSDREPSHTEWVLFTNGFEVTTGYYGTAAFDRCQDDMGPMTHWMPLPKPPQEDAQWNVDPSIAKK